MEFMTNVPLVEELVPKMFPSVKVHLTLTAMAKILKIKKRVQVFCLDLYGENIKE